jgi:hypothetical protein
MDEAVPHAYDQALADTLEAEGETAELRERLLTGGASAEDRLAARENLDDLARRRFDLAHPVAPHDSAHELDGGELEIARSDLGDDKAWKALTGQLRDRVAEALADAPAVESVVRVDVRISGEDE